VGSGALCCSSRKLVSPPLATRRHGQPLSFSASSVWGISTRFRLQIGMIPRCERSFGTPQAIGELKAKPGGELQVHGSGALIRWLLDNDLVDEMNLLIVPVVLGQGTRLFPDAGPDIALDLVDSRADSKGVTIRVYRPTGRPRYATATADHDDE
jgi:riboflavin biosynthesis pyrimidine reductase